VQPRLPVGAASSRIYPEGCYSSRAWVHVLCYSAQAATSTLALHYVRTPPLLRLQLAGVVYRNPVSFSGRWRERVCTGVGVEGGPLRVVTGMHVCPNKHMFGSSCHISSQGGSGQDLLGYTVSFGEAPRSLQ
jgi:hypothetical protein